MIVCYITTSQPPALEDRQENDHYLERQERQRDRSLLGLEAKMYCLECFYRSGENKWRVALRPLSQNDIGKKEKTRVHNGSDFRTALCPSINLSLSHQLGSK